MIMVNKKSMEWKDKLNLSDVFGYLGLRQIVPSVIVQINGILIKRKEWEDTEIADNSEIRILKILRGG